MAVLLAFSLLLSGCGPMQIFDPVDMEQARYLESIMTAIQEKDVDSLSALFSKNAKENATDLEERLQALVSILSGNVISYQDDGGQGRTIHIGDRSVEYSCHDIKIHTEKQNYDLVFDFCSSFPRPIKDHKGINLIALWRVNDRAAQEIVGKEYMVLQGAGVYIGDLEPGPIDVEQARYLDSIMTAIQEKDVDGLYALFSKNAKENATALEERLQTLVSILSDNVVSYQSMGGLGFTKKIGDQSVEYRHDEIEVYTETQSFVLDFDFCSNVPESVKDYQGINVIAIRKKGDSDALTVVSRNYLGLQGAGIYIGDLEPGPIDVEQARYLESIMTAIQEKDVDGLSVLFSKHAKKKATDLEERLQALVSILSDSIVSYQSMGGLGYTIKIRDQSVEYKHDEIEVHTEKQDYVLTFDFCSSFPEPVKDYQGINVIAIRKKGDGAAFSVLKDKYLVLRGSGIYIGDLDEK